MKDSALLVRRRLERFLGFDALRDLTLFRPGSDKGFMTLYLGLRLAVLMGVVLRLFLNINDYHGASLRFVLLSIAAFLLYIFALVFLRAVNPVLFVSSQSKLAQILIDVVLFSMFYLSTNDKESDLFILYSLPLLIAARYFGIRISLMVLGFVSGALLFVVMETESLFALSSQQIVLKIFLPRVFFFVIVTAAWILSHLEKARLYDNMRDRALTLEALRDTSLEITKHLAREDLLQSIIQRAVKLLWAKGGGLYEYDPAQGELTVVADWGGRRSIVGNKLKLGEGMAGRVVQTGDPLIVDDYGTWSERAPIYEPDLFRAVVEVPLRWEDRILGVLYVTDAADGRVFTQKDADLLGLLASQAAIAMENARLLEETHRRARALEALHRISLDITSYQRVPELVKSILGQAVDLLQTKGGGLYLLDESGERVKLAAVSNFAEHLLGMTLEVGDSVVGRVIKTKAPLSVADYRNWVHRLRQYDEYGFTAVAGAPIAWQDKIWGAIAVHTDVKGRTFIQEDLDLLCHLGNLAAVALENARRTDELERLMASTVDAIIVVDEKGKVVKFNKQAEKILRYRVDEVLGQPVGPLYYDLEESKKVKRLLLESKDERITDYDTFVRAKDGEKVPIRLSASLLFDYEGQRAGSVGFFRDLREIESAKRQIRQLGGLLAAGQAIISQLDLPSVLDSIVTNAMEALGDVDAIVLYPYDPDKGEFQVPPIIKGVSQPKFIVGPFNPNSVVARVMEVGEAYFADDAAADPVMAGDFVRREGIASSAGVPLKVGDKTVGVMFFSYRESHPFTDEERNVIRILAHQAAIAIENARLYGETEQRAEQFQTLYQASLSLTAELSLDTVLQKVVDLSRELAGAEYGALGVLDEAGEFEHFITSGLSGEERAYIDSRPCRRGLLDVLLCEGESLRISDISKDRRAVGFPPHHPQMHNLLGLPLFSRGRIIGGLWLTDKQGAPEFTEEDESLLKTLAMEVGVVIENARLYEETRRKLKELGLLHKVATTAASSLELDQVLEGIVNTLVETLCYESVGIRLVDERTKRLKVRPHYAGPLVRPAENIEIDLGQGITGWVAMHGEALLVPDVSQDGRYISGNPLTKSEMCAPLRVGDKAIGVINVESSQTNAFSDHDLRVLDTVAGQVAKIIENARLYEEEEHRARQMAAIAEIGRTINASLELNTTLNAILASIKPLFDYTAAEICLWAEEMQAMAVCGQAGDRRYTEQASGIYTLDEGCTGWIVHHGKPLLIRDTLERNDVQPKVMDPDRPIRSFVGVPLQAGDGLFGTLELISDAPHAFDEDDERLLTLIGEHAIIAIKNAQLFEAEQRRAEQLRVLNELSQQTTLILRLDRLLNQAARLVGEAFNYTIGIGLVEGDQVVFKSVATYGFGGDVPEVNIVPVGEGITGWVAASGEPWLVPDVSKEPRYIPGRPTTRSELAVPLKVQDRTIGVLNVESIRTNAFDQNDVELLQAVAAQLAIAFENARQYEQLERTKETLAARTAVAWMGMVGSTWAHSVRGNAQAVRDNVVLLYDMITGNSSEEKIREKIREVDSLAKGILADMPITPPLSSEEGVESIGLNSLVSERVKKLCKPYGDTIILDLRLGLDDKATVRASRLWLLRALDILVENAIEAMRESELKVLTVLTRAINGLVEIRVIDTGKGIPPENLGILFKQPVPRSKGEKGSGMGLLLASTIVQGYGGDIKLGSTGREGTTMIISLPQEI